MLNEFNFEFNLNIDAPKLARERAKQACRSIRLLASSNINPLTTFFNRKAHGSRVFLNATCDSIQYPTLLYE